MSRKYGRTDDNQTNLVKVMRDLGASVAITSSTHGGFTDTVVGYGGVSVLVEIKDGSKVLSDRQFTPKQVDFHRDFKGAITVIETFSQAVALVNEIRRVSSQINPSWNMGAAANSKQKSNGA
jgi:Holliday junction resolvase